MKKHKNILQAIVLLLLVFVLIFIISNWDKGFTEQNSNVRDVQAQAILNKASKK